MALYQKDYAICPWCGGHTNSRVDHLYDGYFPTQFGSWECDLCHEDFEGTVIAKGEVELRKVENRRTKTTRSMALLKFDGKEHPVFFVMDHRRYWAELNESDEENQGHQRYFFEEHSCPTNWLRECVAVIEEGDCDPHGFLEFIRAVDVPEDFSEDDDDNWRILFPEIFGPAIDLDANRPIRLIEK